MEVFRKALFVTPFAPIPPTEGHRKRLSATLAMLQSLGYRVDLLLLSLEHAWVTSFDSKLFKAMGGLVDSFHFVHGQEPPRPAGRLYGCDDWWCPQFEAYAAWLFHNVSYEIVFTNYIFTSRIHELARRESVRLIDTHDVFAGRREMLEGRGLRAEFFFTDRENERAALARAELVLAIKDEDAAIFRALGLPSVLTLPYAEETQFDPASPNPQPPPDRPVRFGYFASRNQINARNFLEFIDTLDLHADLRRPPLEIWVFGSVCDVLADDPRGRFRRGGRVERVAAFYDFADCVIVPQSFSTGLKIKVAEALAYGKPIICHEHAFEGFGAPLDDALACHSFEDMIRRMHRFAEDAAFRGQLTAAVRRTQRRQAAVVAAGARAAGDVVRRRRDNLLFVIDFAALQRDPLYRLVIKSLTLAFEGGWRTVLAAPQVAADSVAHEDLVGSATALIGFDSWHDLLHPDRAGYDWAAVFVLDHAMATTAALDAFRDGPLFVSEDLTRYLAATTGRPMRMSGLAGRYAICGRTAAEPPGRALSVNYLHGSNWFFEVGREGSDYVEAPVLWLLCHPARRGEAAALALLSTTRLGIAAQIFCAEATGEAATETGQPRVLAAGAAYREAFERKCAPLGVIDLSDGAPVFELLREWLLMNRIRILSLAGSAAYFRATQARFGIGLRAFLADLRRPGGPSRAPPLVPRREDTGWSAVTQALRRGTV